MGILAASMLFIAAIIITLGPEAKGVSFRKDARLELGAD